MLSITAAQRRTLRSRAHALDPVVSISQKGLTEMVLKEIGVCLNRHELIKIRVYNDDREERARYLNAICEQLDAAPVQHIGKLLVIWRPAPADAPAANRPASRKSTASRRNKRSFQGNTPG